MLQEDGQQQYKEALPPLLLSYYNGSSEKKRTFFKFFQRAALLTSNLQSSCSLSSVCILFPLNWAVALRGNFFYLLSKLFSACAGLFRFYKRESC